MSSITALQSADTGAASLTIINSNFSALNTDKIESLSDLSITASAAEINYTDGVTSAIQTQLNAKEATITTLAVSKGGTNIASYTSGDILYASGATTISKLGIGSTGQVLQVSGGAPAWASVAGTGDVTAASALTDNAVVLGDGGAKGIKVLASLGTSGQVLTSAGAGAPPTWEDGGNVTKVGTPVDSQIGVWTGDGTIEGAASLTYDGSNLQLTGDIGSTGTRITKGWFTDLQVTNAIAGSITGNAATVTGFTPASGSLTLSGADALTLTTSAATDVTLPTTGTLATLAGTETFTNKRITERVVTTTDDATSVINIDTTDVYELSAVANNTEFTVTGTPTDGQKLIVRYKDAGVSKTLTWTFATALGITLPAATTAGKWGYVGLTYNLAATQWHAVAYSVQA